MAVQFKKPSLLKSDAFIDGKWVKGKGKTFSVYNPFNETEIGKVADLDKEDAVHAIETAHRAFPSWSALLAHDRAKLLHRFAQLIEQHADDLALILTLEQGKPLAESKEEVLSTTDTVLWLAGAAGRVHGQTICDPDSSRNAITLRQPIGVAAIITPWNFPFSIPIQNSFAALAAGCTVVLKPAEDTPLSALAIAALCEEAGFPAGVFNVVTCLNPEGVGNILTTHPLVSKVAFTGSTEIGKKILANCSSTVKKATMELGGNCPLIVFEDANIDKAVADALEFKFYNAGQCCNSINRFLVHRSIYDPFIDKFAKLAKALTVGSGTENVNIGPLINRAGKDKVDGLVKDAIQKGGELVFEPKPHKGLLCAPIVIKNGRRNMQICQTEIFGPVAVFYPFDTEEEAIAMANDTQYGLAAYFYTENTFRAMRVGRALQAGSVGANTTNVFSVMLPFGGWKESGIGREGGITDALDEYCEKKAVSFGS